MKAEELMIGNCLLNVHNKQIVKLRQIRFGLLEVWHSDKLTGYCTLEDLEPIPLTEELLLKCGFKKTDVLGSYRIGTFVFHSQRPCNDAYKFTLVTEIYFCERRVLVVNGVKYLHELQNLYFLLTKKHLKIEL